MSFGNYVILEGTGTFQYLDFLYELRILLTSVLAEKLALFTVKCVIKYKTM